MPLPLPPSLPGSRSYVSSAARTVSAEEYQAVREAERQRQFEEYKDRVGEVVNGIVKRNEFGNVTVDLGRAEALMREGVTTLEIKSGYGLDLDNELKMLRAARRIGELMPLTVRTTFLGAHTVPAGRDHDDHSDPHIQCFIQI